jgi:hypothetical protein
MMLDDLLENRAFDAAVRADVIEAMFGKPLVTNVFRSLLVEAMIARALGPQWRWCAADFAAWDLEHESGFRLEVKQSAARQSWSQPGGASSSPRFDIAYRKGRWDGPSWIEDRARHAHAYVFAFHPLTGEEADHRLAEQWRFYPVLTSALPEAASISLERLGRLAPACVVTDLQRQIEALLYTGSGSPGASVTGG